MESLQHLKEQMIYFSYKKRTLVMSGLFSSYLGKVEWVVMSSCVIKVAESKLSNLDSLQSHCVQVSKDVLDH